MKWNMKSKKGILKKAAAVMLAVVTLAGMSANGVMPASQVKADEALPGYVRSVYTNEWIPAEQSVVRPIAVMMPTDKVAQLPMVSAMLIFCMKLWRKGKFLGRWL